MLVDLDLVVTETDFSFLSGTTYYIQTAMAVGPGATTFQPGCVIKYANYAYLEMSGSIYTPVSGQLMPALTSKDDDLFGDMIPGSTHYPTYAAAPALWVYMQAYSTWIEDMRIRWAHTAVKYDVNNFFWHTIENSKLQQCQTGIYVNGCGGSMVNVTKCGVDTPIAPPGYPYLSAINLAKQPRLA